MKEKIACILKECRKKNKFSVDYVANELKSQGFEIAPKTLYGYETGKNDTYFKGYKLNGKSFPLVVKLTIHAPWKFYETVSGGKIYTAEQYNDDVKGGVLKFDGKFHFELSIAPELFSKK